MCFESTHRYASGRKEDASAADGNAIGAAPEWPVSRRAFVKGAATVAGAAAVGFPVYAPAETASEASVLKLPLVITVNGDEKHLQIDPRTSLLDLLREELRLTGTKKGCDHGQCGACTVLVNGTRINSCLSLAIVHDGHEVTTIEGLAHGDELNPVQEAFLEHDGYQCGYCTPGQLCSAVAVIQEAQKGVPSMVTVDLARSGPIELTDDEIRERMSGNICRCGAYPGIVAAVRQASQRA
ncbi:MAG: 2Fe-2S iron-sulfur cluster-binding protein [Acidobacteriaceae bacterium]